jgi:pyroglutamyl-peptidase
MSKKILLTSFDIWLPHHQSNSSNDLLIEVAQLNSIPYSLTFLNKLPVDVEVASKCVIDKINELQPEHIICCGMAQKRTQLCVESNASCEENVLHTPVNLEELVADATAIEISHDCGKFVCEGLYYSVLNHLREHQLNSNCIFVHVPILNAENLTGIVADFLLIMQRLALL